MDKKPEYYYIQSAVIPYKNNGKKIKFLLITSRNQKKWIFPKGIIEDHLTPAESAAKEALEEAGIEGKIFKEPVGEYRYQKWGGTCNVKVYLMKVTKIHDEWMEDDFRKRKWFSGKKTIKRIKEPELKDIIENMVIEE